MEDTQMAVSVAITRQMMDFQVAMGASLINGSLEKSEEMRAAGLAAQGVGQQIDIVV